MRKKHTTIKTRFINTAFAFILLCTGQLYAGNPVLQARWLVIKNGSDSNGFSGPILRMRLQVQCKSAGLHRLNSADFYFEYDSSNVVFSKKPVAGKDYVWATGFDPSKHPMYNFSKVVDFGENPFKMNGLNLMDISIIDSGLTTTGTILDSGRWTDVVDVLWRIKKINVPAKFVWDMTKSGDVLTTVYDGFDEIPVNYEEDEVWPTAVIPRLFGKL